MLEQLELLADPGLTRIQALRRGGDVQAAVGDCKQVSELLQGHGCMLAWLARGRVHITISYMALSNGRCACPDDHGGASNSAVSYCFLIILKPVE